MKRGLVLTGVAVVLLALSGCVSVETSEERVDVTPGASGVYSDGDTTVEVEPLTAETPAAASTETSTRDEAAYVASVRDTLRPANVIPNATNDQLIEAGIKACELLASGTAPEDITVIDGEERTYGAYLDSFKIYEAAAKDLC
ncbi:hypothetical protein [Microbacterium testaceum]|uniref:hypothetical protein n=1 Tax=Microbacterium testaceum TaxID=2033 RepID=UPI001D173E67|nr:hypothetical protein [Microbacterium testaceum]MCC4250746.1 hypothetical protein [Microbacterium testaceum]